MEIKEELSLEQKEKKSLQMKILTSVVTQRCEEYKQKTDQALFEELKQDNTSDDYVNAFVRLAFKDREAEINMLSYNDRVINAREAIRVFLKSR